MTPVEPGTPGSWWRRRWRGRPGRLEVWYATATDAAAGTGLWVHGETVAPTDGGPARSLGWAALFPPDAPPVWARTPGGPAPDPGAEPAEVFESEGIRIGPDGSSGSAGGHLWRLDWHA